VLKLSIDVGETGSHSEGANFSRLWVGRHYPGDRRFPNQQDDRLEEVRHFLTGIAASGRCSTLSLLTRPPLQRKHSLGSASRRRIEAR
jgi:hypothetical protein